MPTSHRCDQSRPVIGLSCYREEARWGVWNQRADLLPSNYVDLVVAAGGIPVVLPAACDREEDAATLVDRLDGLIICGGADLEPRLYEAEPHEQTTGLRRERDRWELLLLAAADRRGLPVLGICRGMQLLAVSSGGSLNQHLPDTVDHDRHSPGADAFGETVVTVQPGSRLAELVGRRHVVGCHHHQAVVNHPGFACVARAEDGTVEAIEASGDRFVMGVQWHPEAYAQQPVFAALVVAARHMTVTRR